MKKHATLFLLFTLLALTCSATITLPQIIGDNMVLQQNTKACLWGKAAANATVTVTVSWDKAKYTAKAQTDGKWKIAIPTPAASFAPQTITLSDGNKKEDITLKNILIGEVWFCSGQSNMEMPVSGFRGCPTQGANEEICNAAQYKGVRCANIEKAINVTPQEEVKGVWQCSTPEFVPAFSATAYFFATTLSRALDIPVGIINCSWGGSWIEAWMPRDIVKSFADVHMENVGNEKIYPTERPTTMYNGMIKPLENYTIAGFIWYQGESNVGNYSTYAAKMQAMVKSWRSDWALGELPFYYVEIAPYAYGGKSNAALLREQQYKAQEMIPSSGMISTNDLVEPFELYQIHPKDKKNVGSRLAYMALKENYGMKGIMDRGPEYKSMEVKDSTIVITVKNAPDGLVCTSRIQGFEIAGSDKVFYPAQAQGRGEFITVTSSEVKAPVAVRYCFKNFAIGNVFNSRMLPLVPFRTDNWE